MFSPRPLHYIVRPGLVTTLLSGGLSQGPARLVPLIAVDQLPAWLDIVGVPRNLPAEDAVKMVAIVGGSESGNAGDGVYDVRVLQDNTSTVPATPTKPKIKVKIEEDDDKTSLLASIPQYENIIGMNVDGATEDKTEDKEHDKDLPDIGALKITGDNDKITKNNNVTIVPYEQFCKIVDRLNEQPRNTKDVVVRSDKQSSESSTGSGNNSDGEVDNLIDIETFSVKGEATVNKGKFGVGNNDSKTTSNKGSPKGTKTAWPAQKKRDTSAVKPCRFWCRTGFCSYGQNCRYVHVMPQTPEGLRSVELERVPDWWVAKQEGRDCGGGDYDESSFRGRRRQSTSPRPPPNCHRISAFNSAMQTSRPPRNWKKSTQQANKDSASPQGTKTAATQVVLDFDGVDLVDL
ncbi:hypothetical protein SBRCBS47491_001272 [Sporothrix bragantina]|uniref:C3H1-type domain-containing protein n=1 Tax=Sporothrix bragantina TaxID=671064 RepID=A0ABP0AX72_9PEZI